jgi:hypothetical protein
MKNFVLPTRPYIIQNFKDVNKMHAIVLAFNLRKAKGIIENNEIKYKLVHYLFETKPLLSDLAIQCIDVNVDNVIEMLKTIHFSLMDKAVQDNISSYEKSLFKFLSSLDSLKTEAITPYDIGIISSIPKYYVQLKERELFDDIIEKAKSNENGYYGQVGKRENLELTLISKRFVSTNSFWLINALNEENKIFTYFDSRDVIKNIDVKSKFKVRATVKKHNFSTYLSCKETQLTRISYL